MTAPSILLVEDYPDNRVLITAVLEKAGMEVASAEDGSALDALLASGVEPDLFLIDLSLPGEDGHSILRRLRTDSRWASRPMIALTAHAMAGDAERGLAEGFDAYLTKPINVATIAPSIARFVERRDRRATA